MTVGLAFMLSCAATGAPASEPVVPVTPVVVLAAEQEPVAAVADGDHEPLARLPPSRPCWRHDDSRLFEDCLRSVAPGDGWTVIDNPRPPFGYVCAYFGHRGASCEGASVRLVQRWTDGAPDCAGVLSLYWAPEKGFISPHRPIPMGNGGPSEELRLYAFDSDGTHLVYLRVDDYVIEGEVRCLDHGQAVDEALVDWGHLLQPQVHDGEGKGRP